MTENTRLESASISDRGLSEKRPQNEDSFLEIPECGIFAVADGVGGAQAGEVASQMAVEILGEAFTNISPKDDPEDVMRRALEQANAAIFQMSNELSQLSQMATTVVALHIDRNIATIGHVGDSRLYRLDAEGTLHRETDDHSMVGEEVRAGRMTEEQAEHHPGKNIISRALGAESTVIVDLKTMLIDRDSRFLLCSDGVTRHIGDKELGGLLLEPEAPAAICARIKDLCFERGAEDNLTAVIVNVSGIADDLSMERTQPIEVGPLHDEALLDDELQTVASSRPAFAAAPGPESDEDDELLELDTAELRLPPETFAEPDVFNVDVPAHEMPHSNEDAAEISQLIDQTERSMNDIVSDEQLPADTMEVAVGEPVEVAAALGPFAHVVGGESALSANPEIGDGPDTPAAAPAELNIFGAGSDNADSGSSGSLGRIAASVGLLLVGSVIGLIAYHFFLVPKPQSVDLPAPTQMQSDNIPLSTFEKGRRLVDADPAAYIAKAGTPPSDCEGLYLMGRAYLLTGDFMKGREALVQAKDKLATADPVNRATVSTEIMLALAVTNDPQTQRNLKKDIDAMKPASPGANANVKTDRPK